MKSSPALNWLLVTVLLLPGALAASGELSVSGLKAEFRNGQVFLTWTEPAGDHGGSFSIYTAAEPITSENLDRATCLARRVEAHSARDWWQDPATYFEAGKANPAGFAIREGSPPLDPSGGLFVHTVRKDEPRSGYYAVTMSREGSENRRSLAGVNSLVKPVSQMSMPVEPIWLGKLSDKPAPGSADSRPAVFSLHGRGGKEQVEWLVFGGPELGWREGLPFKFYARTKEGFLQITPTDRTWVGRTLVESWDSRDYFSPAIDTFWYGYNDRIFDIDSMGAGQPVNYTESRNGWILSWARGYFHPDSTRIVLEGGSMGGCGGLSWGLRHPEIFCAVVSDVPLVGYFGPEWGGSEKRLIAYCGPLDRPCSDAASLRQRMDSRNVLQESALKGIDLPFLVLSNARQDMSIPWRPNPRYYATLTETHAGCIVAWDNGSHATCMEKPDPWFKKWHNPAWLFKIMALDKSYLAFSRFSGDSNPGRGDPSEGDLVGFMNYGLEWKDIEDEPGRYAATVFSTSENPVFPLVVDITPRRVQRFKLGPQAAVVFVELDASGNEMQRLKARADRTGHVTFPGFRLDSPKGCRLVILGGS